MVAHCLSGTKLLAQRPLAQYPDEYFDDNKLYLVMYLTLLFKSISGSKQVDLTAPLSRLTSLDAAKDLHSQACLLYTSPSPRDS